MANETLARRYAQAVFQLAQQAGRVEKVGNDLSAIDRAVGEDASTREFFKPAIDRCERERRVWVVSSCHHPQSKHRGVKHDRQGTDKGRRHC